MKTAFIICLFAELAAVLVHLKLPFMRRTKLRVIIGKGTCSLIFTLTAIFAALAQGEGTIDGYGRLIIIGAVFGMIGDICLAIEMQDFWFGLGLLSFFAGHVVYIVAFVGAMRRFDTTAPFFTVIGVIVWVLLLAFFRLGAYKLKAKVHGIIHIGIVMYTAMISVMLIKAVRLALTVGFDGFSVVPALCLILGSMLFVTSDTFLSIGAFTDVHIKGRDYVVLSTYFAAQTLIAATAYVLY